MDKFFNFIWVFFRKNSNFFKFLFSDFSRIKSSSKKTAELKKIKYKIILLSHEKYTEYKNYTDLRNVSFEEILIKNKFLVLLRKLLLFFLFFKAKRTKNE